MTGSTGCVVDANDIYFDDLQSGMRHQRYIQCPGCCTYFVWDKLPDDCVILNKEREEFWGAPAYYESVSGWICPECGNRVSF